MDGTGGPSGSGALAPGDDAQLAEGLRRRDPRAVELFLGRYGRVFHHCVAQFESDAIRRTDLFQELFVALYESLDRKTFDPERGAFGTWLYRVAWCRCVDLKRKQTTRGRLTAAALEDEGVEPESPGSDPSDSAGSAELADLVRAALETLDDEERRLVELRFIDGRTIVELADELQMTLETAKYRLRRATDHLRMRLAQPVERLEALD